jgi:hypothetical protein
LSDGVYRLEIADTLTDLQGNRLDGDGDGDPSSYVLVGNASNRFFQLLTDWNGDAGATIFDFPAIAYWFVQPGFPAYVDVNQDGGVSILDFGIFASRFNRQLVFPPALASQSPAVALLAAQQGEPGADPRDDLLLEHPLDAPPHRLIQGPLPLDAKRFGITTSRERLEHDRAVEDLESVLQDISADILQAWQQ